MSAQPTSSAKVRISNLTRRPVIFSLNSRTTLRLSPGATSGDIPGWEIEDNAQLAKLRTKNALRVSKVTGDGAEKTAKIRDERGNVKE